MWLSRLIERVSPNPLYTYYCSLKATLAAMQPIIVYYWRWSSEFHLLAYFVICSICTKQTFSIHVHYTKFGSCFISAKLCYLSRKLLQYCRITVHCWCFGMLHKLHIWAYVLSYVHGTIYVLWMLTQRVHIMLNYCSTLPWCIWRQQFSVMLNCCMLDE